MNKISSRTFKVWAYIPSHNTLILRSLLKYPDEEGFDEKCMYNIDIEFVSVKYMDIPTTLYGIELYELKHDIPEKLKNMITNRDLKIFEIKSHEKQYYIIASDYIIGANEWPLEKDRTKNFNLEYDNIIATSEN